MARATTTRELASGMRDCAELLEITVDQLTDAHAAVSERRDDVPGHVQREPRRRPDLRGVRRRAPGTVLALHVRRKERRSGVAPSPSPRGVTFPSWLSEHDRRLDHGVTGDRRRHAGRRVGAGRKRDAQEHQQCDRRRRHGALCGDGAGASRSCRRVVLRLKVERFSETVRVLNARAYVMLVGAGKESTILQGAGAQERRRRLHSLQLRAGAGDGERPGRLRRVGSGRVRSVVRGARCSTASSPTPGSVRRPTGNGRVAWYGVHASMTTAGDTWSPDNGVPYVMPLDCLNKRGSSSVK
ncbi:hypothetical protein HU200_041457 [Digitaria exilis]|uniref:Uncharacterized protein n=1 Tax=Digitaria exilis TaxID=1010633 RepID=A0A835EJ12_9POAL|nr:hypothetical protein HU200_041457 [Digitaria exilis]